MENIFSQTNEEFNFKRVYLHKKLETKPSFTDKDLAKEVYDFKIDELRGMKENIQARANNSSIFDGISIDKVSSIIKYFRNKPILKTFIKIIYLNLFQKKTIIKTFLNLTTSFKPTTCP